MPLSEHEQRLLEQMERALHAEDPRLASTLRHGSGLAVNGRRVVAGALATLLGLAGLLGGVASSLVILGVFGFLIMLGGVLLIGSALRTPRAEPLKSVPTGESSAGMNQPTGSKARTPKPKSGGSFMDKVEGRWRRRRGGEGF